MNWLSLSEPIRDFIVGTAAELAGALIEAIGSRVAGRFRPDPQHQALEAALGEGLAAALDSLGLEDETLLVHYADLFGKFVRRERVVVEFSFLLDPRPGELLDVALLRDEFAAAGFDVDYLKEPGFERVIRALVEGFTAAADRQEPLQGLIEIGLLQALVREMGGLGATAEGILNAVSPLARLLQEVVEGQAEQTTLLAGVRDLLQNGTPAQWAGAIRELVTALARYRVEIVVAADGEVMEDYTHAEVSRGLGEALVAELRALRGALHNWEREAAPGDAALYDLEALYRRAVVEEHGLLRFAGILQTGQPVALPLEEVYVSLRALPRREEAETPEIARLRQRREELARRLEGKKPLIGHRRELEQELEDLHRQEEVLRHQLRQEESEPLPLEALWGDAGANRAFVVLGDPGAGKTTLLKFIAVAYAEGRESVRERLGVEEGGERLPVLLPLAAYDAALREGVDMNLVDFLAYYHRREKCLGGLAPVFSRAIEAGRAVVLLDGLDEVLEADGRRRVASRVDGLLHTLPPGNRVVASSRIVGYRQAPLSSALPHYTLLDWSAQERARFLSCWLLAFAACSRREEPATPSAQARAEAADWQARLFAAIEEGPVSIQRLAGNPLLLTILTVVFTQEGMALPRRRVELYARYVRVLVETWNRVRTAGLAVGAPLDAQEVEERLAALALYLQEHHASGTAPREVVERVLKESRLGEGEVARFLDDVRQWTGLLVERGRGAFGFLHLTFQEYLAARALAGMSHTDRMARLQLHLHDPRWQEVICLTAGRLDSHDDREVKVGAFIEGLLEVTPPPPRWVHPYRGSWLGRVRTWFSPRYRLEERLEAALRRGTFLAAACLGDLVTPPKGLARRVAGALIDCLHLLVWEVRERAAASLILLGQVSPEVIGALLHTLSDDDSWFFDQSVASILGQLGKANPEVVSALLRALKSDSWRVRRAAASSLGQLEEARSELQGRLLQALGDTSWSVRQAAAASLVHLEQVSPKVIDTLLRSLSRGGWRVRLAAAASLANLEQATPEVVSALIHALDDRDGGVRQGAAMSLVKLRKESSEAIEMLLDVLDDRNSDVRRAAAASLGNLEQATQEVVGALCHVLGTGNRRVRQAAAASLVQLGQRSSEVIDELLHILRGGEQVVRQTIASCLVPLGRTEPEVLHALCCALADDSSSVRRAVALSLGELGQVITSRARSGIIGALRHSLRDKSRRVRQAAASSLAQLGEMNPKVVHVLRDTLDDDSSWYIFQTAASKLLQIGVDRPYVVRALLEALEGGSVSVRQAAAESLGQLGQAKPYVLDQLLRALRDRYFVVRDAAWLALERLAGIRQSLQVSTETPQRGVPMKQGRSTLQ